MNTKNYLSLGILAVAFGGAALAATKLDTFDTYIVPGTGVKGFNLTSTGALVQDGPDLVPVADTDFTNLQRRAYLSHASVGNASFKNSTGAPTKYASWGNDENVASTAVLRYEFSSNQNFGISGLNLEQIEFDFLSSDAAGSIYIELFGSTAQAGVLGGLGQKLDGTLSISSGATGIKAFDHDDLVAKNGGTSGIWDSVRVIRFTLTTGSLFGTDWAFDSIGLSNPSVPEAETMIPVISFAGLAGFMAWRRRAAK